MMSPQEKSAQIIVRCADEIRRIYLDSMGARIIAILVVWALFASLAWLTGAGWLQFAGMVVVAAVFVVPVLRRIHLAYARQPCPSCGGEVGGYETTNNRIHLACRHCGAVTPTDCAVYVMGGIPSKLD